MDSESPKDKYLGLSKSAYYRKRRKIRVKKVDSSPKEHPRTPELQDEPASITRSTPAFQNNDILEEIVNNPSSSISSRPDTCDDQFDGDGVNQQQACLLLGEPFNSPSHRRHVATPFPDLSSSSAILRICDLARKHSLTDQCMDDLLKLLHDPVVIGNRSTIPSSEKGLESASGVASAITTIGWKCSSCMKNNLKTIKQGVREPNLKCCNISLSYNNDHFIILSARQVLGVVLPIMEKAFFENNLAEVKLILNTDGAPLFKGSKSSFWPVLAAIDQTKFIARRENVILLGLWVGLHSSKPDFNIFMTPIVNDLRDCSENGVEWLTSDGNSQVSRINVKAVVCDSIARPLVQNMNQFNAQFGCGYCFHEQRGPYFKHVNLPNIRWRSRSDFSSACQRLNDDDCQEPMNRGVKGPSPLENLPGFDIIYGFPPDVLHMVYLGVTKHLTEAWINSNNHLCPFYMKPALQRILNSRLQMIIPPTRVSRPPRTLDNIKFYKGHEFMMWLLYYSPVVLKGILKDNYYEHWLLFVRAISVLTSERVNDYIIAEAEKWLEQFSAQIDSLYGKSHERFNIHLLLHFGKFVKMYGPLQNYSMTIFETFNMVLQKYVSSSYGVGRQVCKRYVRDLLVRRYDTNYPKISCVFEGSYMISYVPTFDEEVMLRTVDVGMVGFKFYSRVKNSKVCLHSEVYLNCSRHDNSFFMLDDHLVFQAKFFVQHMSTNRIFAIGKTFEIIPCKEVVLPHCWEVLKEDSRIMEIPSTYLEIVMKVPYYDKYLFFRFLNCIEAWNE